MQHLQAKNLLSAEEYLLTNSQICESAIDCSLKQFFIMYAQSVNSFKNALMVAEETKCRPQ
ncbi:hypothetical protein C2G38_2128430, partial [Gigaspora rosea]